MINLNYFLLLAGIEIGMLVLFYIIVDKICGLTKDNVKNNPRRAKIRERLIKRKNIVFFSITLLLVAWGFLQIFFVELSPSYPLIVVSIMSIIFIIYNYKTSNLTIFFLLIQIFVCIFFMGLGGFETIEKNELIKSVEINYEGAEKLPDVHRYSTTFVDFYYYSEAGVKKCVSSEDHTIKVVYDVSEGENEYYNLYEQVEINKIPALGVYYTYEDFLIEFHVRK